MNPSTPHLLATACRDRIRSERAHSVQNHKQRNKPALQELTSQLFPPASALRSVEQPPVTAGCRLNPTPQTRSRPQALKKGAWPPASIGGSSPSVSLLLFLLLLLRPLLLLPPHHGSSLPSPTTPPPYPSQPLPLLVILFLSSLPRIFILTFRLRLL